MKNPVEYRHQAKLVGTFLLIICLGSLLLGCNAEETKLPLEILGDIENPLSINSLAEAPGTQKLEHREETIEAASLAQLLEEAEPYGEQFEVLFIAADGFSALITNDGLSESYLALSKNNGWEAINLNHPVSSNIKDIREIIIVCQDMPAEQSFNIIQPGKNIASLSVGEMYKNGYSVITTLRGTATVENQGQELTATTYYRHRAIDLEDYVNLSGRDTIVVVGEMGEVEPLRQDGHFILGRNSLSYVAGDISVPEVRGIVLDPPEQRITGVYQDIQEAFEEGIPILAILVDGFGLHQYHHAKDQGHIPFLDTLPDPVTSMSAYPSITPVNLAASLSGELPHVNGVHDRRTRQLDVPTIFALGKELGKSMTAVFGPLGTIELEIEPVFTVDRNDNDSSDDEKSEYALEVIAGDLDLLFVHYKSVDSTGHSYGDLHENTMEVIGRTDDYIRQLVSNWNGKVLIYSDHGMYATETGGNHGALLTESMFTPYWLFETGE